MKIADFDGFISAFSNIWLCKIVEKRGSGPRTKGTWMLIDPKGNTFGTIGGGQLEYMTMNRIADSYQNIKSPERFSIKLGPEIGQCCGGQIIILLQLLDQELINNLRNEIREITMARPQLLIFGAGNVGKAIAKQMLSLPFETILIDPRQEVISGLTEEFQTCFSVLPEQQVRSAPEKSAYVIVTHDHSLDFLLAEEALDRDDASYIGMIGSKTKLAVFQKWLAKRQKHKVQKKFHMPIGTSLGSTQDKRPEIIAAYTVAEIVHSFEKRLQPINNELGSVG